MEAKSKKRRIGLVLASIHTGASKKLWADVAHLARTSEDALFVFPGGRLECRTDYEYLRNGLYSLVNGQNLDGYICWGSAMGGAVATEEVLAFLERFGQMPCVTIGLKRKGFPAISFDAYSGVQNELLHCIEVHHARHIAFIRGPENHRSADDRYRAYRDTLEVAGIPFDSDLVTDAFPWPEGERALSQLVDERHLVPGKDFDTLACSSDMMMFAAGQRLERMGFSFPEDLRIVGFNDSSESRLLKVPCTTARMPVRRLAQMAWSMIEDMVSGNVSGCPDILLPAECVIRRSCGCEDSVGGVEKARQRFVSLASYFDWLVETFRISDPKDLKVLRTVLDLGAVLPKEEADGSRICKILADPVHRYLDGGGDPDLLDEALRWFSTFFATEGFRSIVAPRLRNLFLRQLDLVANEHAYAVSVSTKKLSSLKCDLLCVRNLAAIPPLLARHLRPLGLHCCHLVLHEDDQYSRYAGGYDDGHLYDESLLFGKALLLPPHLSQGLEKGVFVVESLFMDSQPLGYLVIGTEVFDGGMLEEIRMAIGSAVKGTFLMEAANRAREHAEHAERIRTEFFANVSDGLREPLDAVAEHIGRLLKLAGDVPHLEETIREIDEQVARANHLLDFTLSQVGGLEMERVTCNFGPLLETFVKQGSCRYDGSYDLPAVLADRVRLLEVFSIIAALIVEDGGTCRLAVEVREEGLACVFSSSHEGWNAMLNRQEPGLSLAERLVLMHGGTLSLAKNRATVLLPWPPFAASDVLDHGLEPKRTYCLVDHGGEAIPEAFSSLSHGAVLVAGGISGSEGIPPDMGMMLWDGRTESLALQRIVPLLARDSRTAALPVVCLGCPDGYPSVADALSSRPISPFSHSIFVVGTLPAGLSDSLGKPGDFIPLEHEGIYEDLASRWNPSIIIADSCAASLFEAIRKKAIAPLVPIVVIADSFGFDEVERLSLVPQLLLANPCVLESKAFLSRIRDLMAGDTLLPTLTGALVKRAVAYLDRYATTQISRWQLAESVNVSEDYLTRIFRKELGLSPWDYLNRHRIHLAVALLRQTGLTINEVASRTGFQDQAYFCRVFRKIKGCPPGKIRSKGSCF